MKKTILSGFAAAIVLAALPVLAQTNVDANANANVRAGGASLGANLEARISMGKERATQEIDRRIKALTEANTRVQAFARVSAAGKAAIADEVQSQIAALTELKAKIEADTDIETLRTDIKSITASYRIFLLIIPQTRILVAADKIQTVAATMASFSEKLQTRISAAQTSGQDVTEASTKLDDMNANIADAQAKASAAVSAVVDLNPDNGDTAAQEANASALREARADIQAAMKDLQAARKDAGDIVKLLKGWSASADASVRGSVESQ